MHTAGRVHGVARVQLRKTEIGNLDAQWLVWRWLLLQEQILQLRVR
jgi:hypothetical protein